MVKFIKDNYKQFLFSLIFGLITYNLYFQAHYVHDSYRIYNFGFLQNLEGFWTQGRPICMWFNILFNFLHISPRLGQIISVFTIIVFLSISSCIINKLIIKNVTKSKKIDNQLKLIIMLISNGLFFNIFITDWMLFFEGCVFALGCLVSIIAAYFIIEEKNILKKYLLSSSLLIVSVFCYQAVIALAGSIIILFTIYKNKDKKLTQILFYVILNILPYFIALLTNFIFIKIINLENFADARLSGNINIIYNLTFTIKQFKWYYIDMFGYPTRIIVPLITFITFIYFIIKLILNKEIKLNILFILISLFSLWFLSVLPIIAMPSDSIYFISRSIPYLASVFPFMMLSLFVFNNNIFIKSKNILFSVLIVYTIIVSISSINVTAECLVNNSQDVHIAQIIQNEIDEYEKKTNNKIDTIILLPDNQISLNEKNIKYYSDNSVRAMSSSYGTRELMFFVSKRDYKILEGTKEQKNNLFGDKEWNTFEIEQLNFQKNILYLVKY